MPCTSHANPLANTLCFPQILLSSQLRRFHVRLSPPIRGPWHPFGIGHCNPKFFGCNGHHAGQSKQKHNICYHDHTTRIGKALHPQTCNYWDWCLRYIQYCLKHEPYFLESLSHQPLWPTCDPLPKLRQRIGPAEVGNHNWIIFYRWYSQSIGALEMKKCSIHWEPFGNLFKSNQLANHSVSVQ